METWKKRLQETLILDRDAFTQAVGIYQGEAATGIQSPTLPRGCDLTAQLNRELACDAIENSPAPYILNVGCGFAPTSVGFRNARGVPVTVVGVDPLAFPIGEALATIAAAFPDIVQMRRFVLPLVAEEMSAAIPAGSFHGVWSEDAILDCVDPFRFVTQCARACKEGGLVCIKFTPPEDPEKRSTLWAVEGFDGSKVAFTSDRGRVGISEVRGERIEMHTLLDGSLMMKIRIQERSAAQVQRQLQKSGIILTG